MKKIALSQQPKSTGHEEIRIQMSFIEIYNEKVYDLLVPKEQDLQIREDQQKNIFIANLAQVFYFFIFFYFLFLSILKFSLFIASNFNN